MTDRQPRTREQRRADTLAKLSAPAMDVWVATAAAEAGGIASSHLVPLSLAWIDERVVLATEAVRSRPGTSSASGRPGRARPSPGPARDVIMIDAEPEQAYGPGEGPRPAWPGSTRCKRTGTRAPPAAGCGSWCCARCGSRPGGRSMSCPGVP